MRRTDSNRRPKVYETFELPTALLHDLHCKNTLNDKIFIIKSKNITKFAKTVSMTAILLQAKNIDKSVVNLIYDKQLEFTKKCGRKMSLEKTVNKLLKDAYLKKEKE